MRSRLRSESRGDLTPEGENSGVCTSVGAAVNGFDAIEKEQNASKSYDPGDESPPSTLLAEPVAPNQSPNPNMATTKKTPSPAGDR